MIFKIEMTESEVNNAITKFLKEVSKDSNVKEASITILDANQKPIRNFSVKVEIDSNLEIFDFFRNN